MPPALRVIAMTIRIRHQQWKRWVPVIMSAIASQITGVSIMYSIVCSGADQRKHKSSASLAFVRGIHRWPVVSPHKGPVTRKMFPFDDVIMLNLTTGWTTTLDRSSAAQLSVYLTKLSHHGDCWSPGACWLLGRLNTNTHHFRDQRWCKNCR